MNPFHVERGTWNPNSTFYGRLLSLSFVGGLPIAVLSNVSTMKGIPMQLRGLKPNMTVLHVTTQTLYRITRVNIGCGHYQWQD